MEQAEKAEVTWMGQKEKAGEGEALAEALRQCYVCALRRCCWQVP